jgi:hypothetical protein
MRQSLSFALLLAAGLSLYGCGGESRHPPTSPTAPAAAVVQPPDPPASEPLPLRTVRGSVQDLDGLPLVGVKVTTAYSAVSYTDAVGMYSVPYPVSTAYSLSYVIAGDDDFEPRTLGFGHSSVDVQLPAVRLQRKMFLDLAGSISGTISAVDQSGWIGEPYDSDWCAPCKTVRLRSDSQRSVTLELRWSADAPLQMWVWTAGAGLRSDVVTPTVGGGATLASLRFVAIRGETILHVGFADPYPSPTRVLSHPVSFTLSAVPQ